MFHLFRKKKEQLPDDVTKSAYHAGGRYLPSVTGTEAAWMVFRDTTLQQIEEALEMDNCEDTTVMEGKELADTGSKKKNRPYLLILGEEDGMFYVIGERIVGLTYQDEVLKKVCTGFSEVSLYISFRSWNGYGFAKIEDGEIIRSYYVDKERIVSQGDPTKLELELEYRLPLDLKIYKDRCHDKVSQYTFPDEDMIKKYAAYETGLYMDTVTWSSVVGGYSKALEKIER